jgi:hypothetical protein
MDDLHQAESMLADIAGLGRITVSGRGFAYVLHDPTIQAAEGADFAVAGRRRRRVGDARTWQAHGVAVAKLLRIEKRRLVVVNTLGQVLVLTAATEAGSEDED